MSKAITEIGNMKEEGLIPSEEIINKVILNFIPSKKEIIVELGEISKDNLESLGFQITRGSGRESSPIIPYFEI